jgi:hypothetical protein
MNTARSRFISISPLLSSRGGVHPAALVDDRFPQLQLSIGHGPLLKDSAHIRLAGLAQSVFCAQAIAAQQQITPRVEQPRVLCVEPTEPCCASTTPSWLLRQGNGIGST